MTFFQWIKDNETTLEKTSQSVIETYYNTSDYKCVIAGLDFKPFQNSVLQCDEFNEIFIHFVDMPVFRYYNKCYAVNEVLFSTNSKSEKIYESMSCQEYFQNFIKKQSYEIALYGFSVNNDWNKVFLRFCKIINIDADKNRDRIRIIDKMLDTESLILQ